MLRLLLLEPDSRARSRGLAAATGVLPVVPPQPRGTISPPDLQQRLQHLVRDESPPAKSRPSTRRNRPSLRASVAAARPVQRRFRVATDHPLPILCNLPAAAHCTAPVVPASPCGCVGTRVAPAAPPGKAIPRNLSATSRSMVGSRSRFPGSHLSNPRWRAPLWRAPQLSLLNRWRAPCASAAKVLTDPANRAGP